MEVRQAIEEIDCSLRRVTAEDELLDLIVDQLTALRRSYRAQRSSFSPGDIEFLKGLSPIADQLREFIELKEELTSVNSLKEYEDLVNRLTSAKCSLAFSPVSKRISKEISPHFSQGGLAKSRFFWHN